MFPGSVTSQISEVGNASIFKPEFSAYRVCQNYEDQLQFLFFIEILNRSFLRHGVVELNT